MATSHSDRSQPKLVVLTGGPGAGKTAVLELAQRDFCEHVVALPESAGIVFRGGFPRRSSLPARQAAQRAIYHLQRELERLTIEEERATVALCDRGTLDALAYWPGPAESFFEELGTSLEQELARYAAVIHLRTPSAHQGYNNRNPARIESAKEAALIDERIVEAWAQHPRRMFVPNAPDFLTKAQQAIALIKDELSPGCLEHSFRSRANEG
jgi:predicted ATPase